MKDLDREYEIAANRLKVVRLVMVALRSQLFLGEGVRQIIINDLESLGQEEARLEQFLKLNKDIAA